jgi:proteasome lid subunit RPN8/RPN11
MMLWLQPRQADQIVDQAYTDLPRETCGLIGGLRQGSVDQAVEIIPVPNTASDLENAYRMDEHTLAAALTGLEKRGLTLVGIYHSHPQGDPVPSHRDIREAAYPDTAYLIIGMKGDDPRLAAWMINYDGTVEHVELHISPAPPAQPASSRAVSAAVLIAGLIGFIFLIVVSLSLLPPAPEIPR